MRRLVLLCLIVLISFCVAGSLTGCGPDSGKEKSDTGTLTPGDGGSTAPDGTEIGPPANIELSSTVPPGTSLSKGGSATVTAVVTDVNGFEVANGTRVDFSVDKGAITASKLTVNGVVNALYQAGASGGIVTITASTLNGISEDIFIDVATGDTASLIFEDAVPQLIGVLGSGKPEISTLTFNALDSSGSPVPDGTTVNFSIKNPLGGGEKLAQASGSTAGGQVTVSLQSGTVSGTVAVAASINNIQTEGRVTIVSGLPDAEHVGLAANFLNVAGGVYFGLQDTISAFLGDRYGNVVPDDTPVSFITECGTIGQSNSPAAFTTTTSFGVATGILQTSNPTVPNLDGLMGLGNVGLCRVVAFTPGSESFDDINGNAVFDQGTDVCTTDLDEPYIDANDNGMYDAGETYIDANTNGVFDAADGTCQQETMVWGSMNVLISDNLGPFNIRNSDDSPIVDNSIPIGACRSFLFDVQDLWGNALVAGTDLTTDYDGPGTFFGVTLEGFPDTNGSGSTFGFTVCSETDPEAESDFGVVTITLDQDAVDVTDLQAPGNNGFTQATTSLILLVNAPGPAPAPAAPFVLFTVPADGSTSVGVGTDITIVFSEPMNPLTVTAGTVTLFDTTAVMAVPLGAPTASDGNTTFTFTPVAPLNAASDFDLTISSSVLDQNDFLSVVGAPVTISFSTQ